MFMIVNIRIFNPSGMMPVEYIEKYIEITKNNCRLSQKVNEKDIDRLVDYIWLMYDNTILDDGKYNKFTITPMTNLVNTISNGVKLDKRD